MWLVLLPGGRRVGWERRSHREKRVGGVEGTGMRFPTPTGTDLPTEGCDSQPGACPGIALLLVPTLGGCLCYQRDSTQPGTPRAGHTTIQVTSEAHTSHSGHQMPPPSCLKAWLPSRWCPPRGQECVTAEGGGIAAWGPVLETREGRALALQGICHCDWEDSL